MRFVVFSDMHFHDWQLGSKINAWGVGSRLYSQYLVMEQMCNYCLVNGINTVFFSGDFFHTFDQLSATVLYWAQHGLRKFTDTGISVFMIPGNHDMANKSGTVNSLSVFNGFGGKCMVSEPFDPSVIDFGVSNGRVGMIPYTESREQLLATINGTHYDILFLHQGVSGEPMPSGFVIPDEILRPSDIPDSVQMAFTGHYHNHKRVSNNLTIVGAPMQHTWGDAGQVRGWIDYDTETGELKHIESKAPKFFNEPPIDIDVAGHFVRTKAGVMVDDKAAYIQVLPDVEESVTIHDMKLPEDMSPLALVNQYAKHAKLGTDLTAKGVALVKGEYEIKDTRTKQPV